MSRRNRDYDPFAVFDLETDPFQYGRVPAPFAIGFLGPSGYCSFWGDDCLDRFLVFLAAQPALILYAHNGGRFDFLFFLEHLRGDPRVINGRVVEARLLHHTLRDSFAILPVPLGSTGEKEAIDYALMERDARDRVAARRTIERYLMADCRALHHLVSQFRARFGDRLTAAGTAIRELERFSPIPRGTEAHDECFRRFYLGGRVECFAKGIHTATRQRPFRVFDINSMYPYVMRNHEHPASFTYRCTSTLKLEDPHLAFAIVDGTSHGVLPLREGDAVSFPHRRAIFHASVHELRAGVDTGTLAIHGTIAAYYCDAMQRFEGFVDHWCAEKEAATRAGDVAGRIFSKIILNSAYGKMGTNPREFFDYRFRHPDTEDPPPQHQGWKHYADVAQVEVWRRPSVTNARGFYDVAVAASITGAARAVLWRSIVGAERVMYCDTDSIICEALAPQADLDPARLGAWKEEARGTRIAIAGKKTYALEGTVTDENGRKRRGIVKKACKGVDLDGLQIFTIATGNTVDFYRDAPTMSVRGNSFTHRRVRMT